MNGTAGLLRDKLQEGGSNSTHNANGQRTVSGSPLPHTSRSFSPARYQVPLPNIHIINVASHTSHAPHTHGTHA